MAVDLKNRRVTFRPFGVGQPRIFLDVDEIARHGGLVPDVWCAEVPYTSLATIGLGDVSYEVTGVLELWYTNDPTASGSPTADVTLTNVAVVGVQAVRWGYTGTPSTYRAITYRISIADHRRAWVAPRGGLLFDGPLNPDPLPSGGTLTSNSDLMQRCVDAMGVTAIIPDSVNDAEAIRELDWSAEHAPTALQELLEHTGHVYAPLLQNAGVITKPGSSTGPTFPVDRLISNVPCQSIDRQATTAIFISAPATAVHSFSDAASSPPAWKYVAQDPDASDRWRPLSEISALGTAATEWTNGFKDVDEAKRLRLSQQVYRCIQLDTTKYPPGKVVLLPHFLGTDLKETEVRLYVAGMFIALGDGSYGPQQSGQWLVPAHVDSQDNVLIFGQPLVKPTSGAAVRRQQLTGEPAVPEASIKPWFSVEAWDADAKKRKYAAFGFIVFGGTATPIGDAATSSSMVGYQPNVCIYRNSDLQLVDLNAGTTTNRDAMTDRATTYATAALGVSPQTPHEARIKGFEPIELDGAVSDVVYEVKSAQTRVALHAWHATGRRAGGRDE